jgi:hypothetical protein
MLSITRGSPPAQVLDLATLEAEQTLCLDDFKHLVTAYLNSLAPSSRRPTCLVGIDKAYDWCILTSQQLFDGAAQRESYLAPTTTLVLLVTRRSLYGGLIVGQHPIPWRS